MKIYFCDICNQSIPIQDLDSGAAVAVKGKLLCAQCNAAVAATAGKGGATHSAAASAGSGGLRFGMMVLIGLAATAFGVFFVEQRAKTKREELRAELTPTTVAAREAAQRAEQSVADLREEQATMSKKVELLQGDSRTARAEDAGRLQHEVSEISSRLEKIKGYLEDNERQKESLQQLEIRIAASNDTIATLRREVDSMRVAIAEGPPRPAVSAASESKPAATTPEPAPSGDAAAALPLEIQKQLKLLQSSDAGKRWEAVGELGRSADPRVVAFLVPMLRDKDDFVRHQTAQVLGDLDAKAAILPLIDALGDEQLFVREQVYTQLRKITRKSLKFDPSAKKEERDKQQRSWRTWAEQQTQEKGAGNG